MFDLIAHTMMALNQLTAFLAALACAGLGAVLLGSALYWRLHAVPVQGVVVGVRRSGNCFNAVYRYTSPSGESVEATSLEGSSSTRGKETGTQVPLRVIPGRPQEVQEAGQHLFTLIGAVLLAIGIAIFCYAVKTFRTGPMTWVVAFFFVAHLLNGLRRILVPQDKSLRTFRLRPWLSGSAAAAPPAAPVVKVEDLAAAAGNGAPQGARLRRLAPLLLLAGLGVLLLGVHESRTLVRLTASGTRVPGVVSGFGTSRSSSGVSYYPLVTYTDAAGHPQVFRDRTGSSPPAYRIGEAVTVLYAAKDRGSAIIDRGAWNWLPALLLYLFGAALTAVGVAALRPERPAPACVPT